MTRSTNGEKKIKVKHARNTATIYCDRSNANDIIMVYINKKDVPTMTISKAGTMEDSNRL